MIRTKSFWTGLVLVLALCSVSLVVIVTTPHRQATAASIQTTPQTNGTRSLGLPAIRPSLSANSTIRITTADVEAYINTHQFAGGLVVKGATFSIVSIQFMTSTQASALMKGEETGLAATAPICYVKLHGPFTQVASVPPGVKLPTVAYGIEIFDARTGNLLMWWTPSA